MAIINADQESEISFISGVTAQGTIAAKSYWSWADNSPATYNRTSTEGKWGETRAGTAGALTVAFDPASNWTDTEKAAFTASMHLWSAEANITFDPVSNAGIADLVIARSTGGGAQGGFSVDTGNIGSSQLGQFASGSLTIDTSVGGFGPIGSAFSVAGGYPWQTILHELGHVIGLGHAGAYNEGTTQT
ncbi:MAG: peptidase M10, serralysin-like protein, partial [Sphingomonas sp.]|nr:peptidase M10, serralysin-like protein [Sphingomonas sp.]